MHVNINGVFHSLESRIFPTNNMHINGVVHSSETRIFSANNMSISGVFHSLETRIFSTNHNNISGVISLESRIKPNKSWSCGGRDRHCTCHLNSGNLCPIIIVQQNGYNAVIITQHTSTEIR